MRLNSRKVALSAFVATAIAVPLAVTIGTAAGAYHNGLPSGGRTSVHFKNIKLWRDDR